MDKAFSSDRGCGLNAAIDITWPVGVLLLLAPVWFVLGPRRTRHWATAKARVVDKDYADRGSLMRRFLRFEYGAEHCIEYEVDGRTYFGCKGIAIFTRFGRMRAKSIPIVPLEFDVRYHPVDPERYSAIHAYHGWYVALATAISWGFGLVLLIWWT